MKQHDPGVCESNGDVSFLFLSFLFFSFKESFILLLILLFLVTKTKIRNRKAVFQADSPVKVVKTLHGRIGIIVSVRSVSLCESCVIVWALFFYARAKIFVSGEKNNFFF